MQYGFDDYCLDTQLYTLSRAGQRVAVRPKVFQVLVHLVMQRDRVVSKQELAEQVWSGEAITDAVLETTRRAVRQALGDSARTPRYVQTVRGYGYRFVGVVQPASAGEPL